MLTFDLQRVREKTVRTDIVGYEVDDLQGTIGEVHRTTGRLAPSFISLDTVSSLPGQRMILPAAVIERIDHGTRKIYVDRRRREISNAPQSLNYEADTDQGYLGELRRYYGPGGAGYRAPRDDWTEAFQRAFGGDRIDAAALRQTGRPIGELVRLPEATVRKLPILAAIYVVGCTSLFVLVDVLWSKSANVDLTRAVAVALLALIQHLDRRLTPWRAA